MFAPCLSLAYLLLSTHRNNIAFFPLKARYCISQHTLTSAVNTLAWDLEFLSNHIDFVCVYLHLQRYQTFLDNTVPHLTSRWIATLVMMLLFMARIFYLQVEHFSLWQHNCHSALQSCFLCTFVSRAWHFLLNSVARANFAGLFFITFFCVCVIMATNFLELATTLK